MKLDRSFLQDLDLPASRTIVRATVEMAHGLGLTIVAEGVESESVLASARELGCDAVQGFVTHRPAAAEQVTATLRAGLAPPEAASAL